MIDQADVIFVMERKHKDLLKQRFDITGKQLFILDIEDDYQFNDPDLITILERILKDYL